MQSIGLVYQDRCFAFKKKQETPCPGVKSDTQDL